MPHTPYHLRDLQQPGTRRRRAGGLPPSGRPRPQTVPPNQQQSGMNVADVIRIGLPIAGQIGGELLQGRARGDAVDQLTGGAEEAAGTIGGAADIAQGRLEDIYAGQQEQIGGAREDLRGLYGEQLEALEPYQQAGLRSLGALEEQYGGGGPMFEDQFTPPDPQDIAQDPGLRFAMDQGLQAIRRADAARGPGGGGLLKELTRFGTGTAAQYYDQAFNRALQTYQTEQDRFRLNQANRYGRLRDMAGIGERATQLRTGAAGEHGRGLQNLLGTEVAAGSDFGRSMTELTVGTGDRLAELQQLQAQARASGDIGKANAIGRIIQTGVNTIEDMNLLRSLGLTGAQAAGGQAAIGPITGALGGTAGSAGPIGAATAGEIYTGGLGYGPAAGAAEAGGSGLMSTLGGLATNPLVVGPAAAAGIAIPWIKSQEKWEANDLVDNYENPFGQEFLPQFLEKYEGGQLPPDQALQVLDTNWQQFLDATKQWAGDSDDRNTVRNQLLEGKPGGLMDTFQKIRATVMDDLERSQGGA